MSRLAPAVHFSGSALGKYRHICALFHTTEEKYRVLLPFIREGIERGEKAFHIVDPELRDAHLKHLQTGGIDTMAEERDGQLEVCCWQDVYLSTGHFSYSRTLTRISEVLEAGSAQGYRLTRLVAHMEWALEGPPIADDLIEYEIRLNDVVPTYKDTRMTAPGLMPRY
jgi:hypothetical protein